MLVFILAVSAALVFSFFCSISEAVLLSVSRSRVAALARDGSRAGLILQRFKNEPDVAIAAILILNTVANTAGASVAGASYPFASGTLWIFSLTFTVAVLFCTEIVPKTLGIAHNQVLARPVALGVNVLVKLLRPVLFVTRKISRLVRGTGGEPVTSLEEIRLLAAIGQSEGVVGTHTASMIEGAALLRDLDARDAMVPRNQVAFLSSARSVEENLAVIKDTGYSRFPFTASGDIDQVEGVVLAKDLLFHLRDGEGDPDWRSLLVPLIVIPETTPLHRALRTFQAEKRHLAIVVDEYGGTEGILTLEDVLEEVVGEIEDETDQDSPFLVVRPDGAMICHGLAENRKVFGMLGIDADVESNTMSGFLAAELGKVPATGETLEWNGYRFEVTQATRRRVERIRVVRLPGTAGGGSEGSAD